MSDLMNGTSGYQTGSIDTATAQTNNVSPHNANHINGVAQGVIHVETILGDGPSIKGNKADLVARLAVNMDADGKLTLGTDANLNGDLNVPRGGTGRTTLTATKVLLGDGANDIAFGSGLIYQGPTSTGAGSTAAHEGTVTISGNQALSGTHFYTNFTLNAGITITPAALSGGLIIVATDTITINGTIAANGTGSAGGLGIIVAGNNREFDEALGMPGMGQPGGGGGGSGAGTAGTAGVQVAGDTFPFMYPFACSGGSGGGGGGASSTTAGGLGGAGGGVIVLCAPTVTLGATATLNTSGGNGANAGGGTGAGGGGGGGAGNVYVFCRVYTDSGATFIQTGGTGGSVGGAGAPGLTDGGAGGAYGVLHSFRGARAGNGSTSSGNATVGGAGAAGVKQILIYA